MSTPTIHAIAATSKDGFISPLVDKNKPSTKWTSNADTKYFKEITLEAGVVVMGRNTFKTFGACPLKNRLNIVYTSNPELLQIPWTTELGYTNDLPTVLIDRLRALGFQSVFICGGNQIYDLFQAYIDRLHLTVEKDIVFGNGIPLFTKEKWQKRIIMEQVELDDSNTIITIYTLSANQMDIPKDKKYSETDVQCGDCGGHGCHTCQDKGWLPAGHPHRRICENPDCDNALPPDHVAVYCSNQCAYNDA